MAISCDLIDANFWYRQREQIHVKELASSWVIYFNALLNKVTVFSVNYLKWKFPCLHSTLYQ